MIELQRVREERMEEENCDLHRERERERERENNKKLVVDVIVI